MCFRATKVATIFYRKLLLDQAADIIHVLETTYPVNLKDKFDPVLLRLLNSFAKPSEAASSAIPPPPWQQY